MGADLYINSLPDETRRGGFEVSKEAVKSGYFRDCYNGWGLFAIMSATLDETISWWQIFYKKKWFSTKNNSTMTSKGCKKFWEWMEPKIEKFLKKRKFYRYDYEKWGGDPIKKEITEPDDIAAIKEHAKLFREFYKYAIELKSTVDWFV